MVWCGALKSGHIRGERWALEHLTRDRDLEARSRGNHRPVLYARKFIAQSGMRQ